MAQQTPWLADPLDDMSAVALLLCDPAITVDTVRPKAGDAHSRERVLCEWILRVEGYSRDEFASIVAGIAKVREAASGRYTFRCSICGTEWMECGPCGDGCRALPSAYQFDMQKRAVIKDKVAAQHAAAKG